MATVTAWRRRKRIRESRISAGLCSACGCFPKREDFQSCVNCSTAKKKKWEAKNGNKR